MTWKATFRRLLVLVILLAICILIAFLLLPLFWRHYEHNPLMERAPKITQTKSGVFADPLNVGLIGTEDELVRIFLEAGWSPADPITFETSMKIAASVLLHRRYTDAPISNLYLWGRKQDLAFEKLAGKTAKSRHHVRFWRSDELGKKGRPMWIGAATFDRSVGLSHRTGKITHHISSDVDDERDLLIEDLKKTKQLTLIYQVTGIGPLVLARNGENDPYNTDGELTIGIIAKENKSQTLPPSELLSPPAIQFKNKFLKILKSTTVFRAKAS